MFIQFEHLRKTVTDSLHPLLQNMGYACEKNEIYKALNEPPNKDLAHLCYGCFLPSKALKKSPAQIATDLKSAMEKTDLFQKSILSTVDAAGPYLNIKFTAEFLFQCVIQPILSEDIFSERLVDEKLAPKMMIEYSQPNTHKELHVGHMRNLCLGNALVRLLTRVYGQEKVISATFPGDVGTHVAKCLWYIKNHITESEFQNRKQEPLRGEWLGKMYSAGNLKLEDDEKNPELYEKNKTQLTAILKQLESKKGEFYDLWLETRSWSIDLMNKVYDWADVKFDRWYWESEVDSESVETVKKYFNEGKLQQSQGAIGLDFSNENLGFCMLLKSDGTGLYATKDIELARRKFEDFKIDKSIYVVDQRQALHFKQVFKSLEHLGFEQAKNCYHLQYNFVELPDGAMSSRKGNIVPLIELVEKMKDHVKTNYLKRYESEWSEIEIETVADQVAQGAIKYGMLKQDTNKKIVFDMAEWLKIDGESGPFIQYSAARIHSLIKKIDDDKSLKVNAKVLVHAAEFGLMQQLMGFNTVVVSAADGYKPAALCSYLYDTAKTFNTFYHDCSIAQAETADLKKARLSLAKATGLVLREGLALLGIPTPERM